ncbi:MAG: DUF1778 domain-containing protein [Anaerovoracaceae bacterium]|jgi:uncharacterized protein (DUF1778 family)
MAKTEYLHIRISADQKAAAEKAAELEDRTLSGYINALISKDLKEKGLK